MANAEAIYRRMAKVWAFETFTTNDPATKQATAILMAACIIAEAIRNSTGEGE